MKVCRGGKVGRLESEYSSTLLRFCCFSRWTWATFTFQPSMLKSVFFLQSKTIWAHIHVGKWVLSEHRSTRAAKKLIWATVKYWKLNPAWPFLTQRLDEVLGCDVILHLNISVRLWQQPEVTGSVWLKHLRADSSCSFHSRAQIWIRSRPLMCRGGSFVLGFGLVMFLSTLSGQDHSHKMCS